MSVTLSLSSLASGAPQVVKVDGVDVVVVACEGEIFALEDRCSHEDFPLSEGEVFASSCEIECSRHGATFALRDGAACSLPATKPVATYEVRVEGDVVTVVAP